MTNHPVATFIAGVIVAMVMFCMLFGIFIVPIYLPRTILGIGLIGGVLAVVLDWYYVGE